MTRHEAEDGSGSRAMRVRHRCSSPKVNEGCRLAEEIQTVQPFPSAGHLGRNLGLPLPLLADRIGQLEVEAYSYVVRTVNWNYRTAMFEQHGSAPNFQGDVLTLCTCKHQMRTSRAAEDWKGVWLAGVTSRTIHDGKHWLFYLAKIEWAHKSHADLWASTKATPERRKPDTPIY